MSKDLVVRDEIFPYPETGDINYGEPATGWAEAMTEIAEQVSGPADIPNTEVTLVGTVNGDRTEGTITNLKFDTAYTQSLVIEGFITRTFSDATPKKVEQFTIKGAFNGSVINFSVDYSGDETELDFSATGGQFNFSYENTANTDQVSIKFSARAKVDESFFE